MAVRRRCDGRGLRALGTALAAAGALAAEPAAQEHAWYEEKSKRGANLHDIVEAHHARTAAKKTALQDDLTALLLKDPELYELEKDHRFKRWLEFAEPRVSPSGDLSLLDKGQEVIASMMPLDGRSLPERRGDWQPYGPFAENTVGAGRLNWMEFHPADDSAYMVGSPGGGVWFTRDAGKTWNTTTDDIAILGAAWGAYHPVDHDVVYLGTGDGFHGDTKSLGVLKSADGGKTWETTGLAFPVTGSTQITKLVTDRSSPEKLLVATSSGVHVSLDGGRTFTKSSGITAKVWDLEIHPGDPSIVYASTSVLYRSTDGGLTFAAVQGAPRATYRMQLAVTPKEPRWLYLLRGAREATEGVSLSIDDGGSFANQGPGTEIGCSQVWYDYSFAASPIDANELAAGCLRVFRSTNGGASWSQAGTGYHVDIQGLFYREDGVLYTTNDGGIWRSSGPASWTNLNANLNIGQSYRVGVHKYDYDRVCTGRQDNGTDLRDNGAFRRAIGGDGFECFWNPAGTRFYGESQNGAFNRCTYADGRASGCTGIAPPEAGTWNTPWAHDPKEASTLYGGRAQNVWRSADNGSNWTQLGTVGGSGSIRNFAVAPSDNRVIYVLKGSGVHKTSNGGQGWASIKGAITGTPVSVAVSETDANDVWVTVSGYTAASKVWHSTDGGQSWTNKTFAGLPNLPCNAVVLDDAGGGVYVGMDVGVFYMKKSEGSSPASWRNFARGLPNASVRELEIAQKGADASDRRLIAATYGRGVWSTRLWDETAPTALARRAPEIRRFSATVSPAKSLRIRFQLGADRAEEGASTLRLTAADGTLIHRERVPDFGTFEREIDMARHGSGVYYFAVEGAGGKSSRRIAVP